MKHAIIENVPANPKEILDYAKARCCSFRVNEKGTKNHPGIWTRQLSDLSYEDAFDIIHNNKPHWCISFRNMKYYNVNDTDYWEFAGCNIASNEYGEVFIWIHVDVRVAKEIFAKFGLIVKDY